MPCSVVYLGPSLDVEEARRILDTRFLPPIRRGDIHALLKEGRPDAIGIVDGQFFQSFSISPKEVLRAIDAGVRVYGASSMGALRATELSPYGMIGVGRIYDLFASGAIDADDEVAMVYDSATQRPLSDPMVNIRLAIASAVDAGVISEPLGRRIIDQAKKLYYPDRSYKRVLGMLASEIPDTERTALLGFLQSAQPDAKREDAVELLKQMATYLDTLAQA
ncbi:TfuA-related McrA-glycine thioamidation protein [Chondromyces crocatus]|uniref:TfuA-like core domain-containing protein n=1 Tax=Chondromyces crocatus TaxID=52 RepID=A0A0K1EER9_CHOCO|nr:TfuA-related McrA-glycine thioamidation protein [Chondromyces crocatus]AKT39182.1 uncharacterized protein CMC5_033290 [Chondromyces crocatus]